jgi:hypothetical protein
MQSVPMAGHAIMEYRGTLLSVQSMLRCYNMDSLRGVSQRNVAVK